MKSGTLAKLKRGQEKADNAGPNPTDLPDIYLPGGGPQPTPLSTISQIHNLDDSQKTVIMDSTDAVYADADDATDAPDPQNILKPADLPTGEGSAKVNDLDSVAISGQTGAVGKPPAKSINSSEDCSKDAKQANDASAKSVEPSLFSVEEVNDLDDGEI